MSARLWGHIMPTRSWVSYYLCLFCAEIILATGLYYLFTGELPVRFGLFP